LSLWRLWRRHQEECRRVSLPRGPLYKEVAPWRERERQKKAEFLNFVDLSSNEERSPPTQ
jgi:hypothetical protein